MSKTTLWDSIYNEIPEGKGSRAVFAWGDIVEDTGENWLVWRDGEPNYFIEKKMLVDFLFIKGLKQIKKGGQL